MRHIILLSMVFLAATPGLAAEPQEANKCIQSDHQEVQQLAGSCVITTYSGAYSTGPYRVDYRFESLSCLGKQLVDGNLMHVAKNQCEYKAEHSDAAISSLWTSVEQVKPFGNFVFVETKTEGFPLVILGPFYRRFTYDVRTGEAVNDLARIFGAKKAEELKEQANRLYNETPGHDRYLLEYEYFHVEPIAPDEYNITFDFRYAFNAIDPPPLSRSVIVRGPLEQ